MTDGTDEEGPESARLDLVVVTHQVQQAVLDCFVPGVVAELGELLEDRLLVFPVPRHRVGGNGLEIYLQYLRGQHDQHHTLKQSFEKSTVEPIAFFPPLAFLAFSRIFPKINLLPHS